MRGDHARCGVPPRLPAGGERRHLRARRHGGIFESKKVNYETRFFAESFQFSTFQFPRLGAALYGAHAWCSRTAGRCEDHGPGDSPRQV